MAITFLTDEDGKAFDERINTLENRSDFVLYTTQELTEEQQKQARQNIGAEANNSSLIPDYWQPHLAEKISAIKALRRAGGRDCYSFVVITDYHRYGNRGRRSPVLIRHVMDELGIRFCLNLGDVQNGGAWKTEELEYAEWEAIEHDFEPIRDRMLMIPGNHDGSYGSEDINGDGVISGTTDYYIYNLPPSAVYDLFHRKTALIPGVTFDTEGFGYWVDDPVDHVRYIMINTHYSDGTTNPNGTAINNYMRKIRVGQSQQDMVIGALQSIPADDWHVVVGMHIPLAEVGDSGPSGDMTLLRDVLGAYQGKTTYTGTFGTAGEYDHVSVDVDFSAAKGQIAGVFCGHIHSDDSNLEYAFPIVTSYSDDTTNTDEASAGTVTEQSFDVFTVNKREGAIYATKVGYGSDRVFSFGTQHVVVLDLDGATVNGSSVIVPDGGRYTATVTANAGYSIKSVVVTMDGIDITAEVYADGVIAIERVTGDVVIAVVAGTPFTNLADPSSEDWVEPGYSTHGTATPTTSDFLVTNYIPVAQYDILRFKGFDLNNQEERNPVLVLFDADKCFIEDLYLGPNMASDSRGLHNILTPDQNGVTSYEILMRASTNAQFVYNDYCTRVKYIRFSCAPATTADDIIITVNEEIFPSAAGDESYSD